MLENQRKQSHQWSVGIGLKTLWIGSESGKGYERGDFDDAFRRYLPA